MSFRFRASVFAYALVCLGASFGQPSQKHKNEEPKSQVQPLPPEPPMALMALTNGLDFHLSPRLKTGGLSAQIRASLGDLIRDTKGEVIVKLRAFVAGSGDARRVQAQVAALFTERRLPLPVLTIVQVGGLGQQTAQVVIEAVVSTNRTVNPNGLAFFFGQRGGSLRKAVDKLLSSSYAVSVNPEKLLSITCFTAAIADYQAEVSMIQAIFPNSAVNLVQAVRDPGSEASSCEGTAQLNVAPTEGPVVRVESAGATLVASPQLILTGLQLSFGSYLDDAHEAFSRLLRTASALQNTETPVEVNAFALDAPGASAVIKSIPPSAGKFHVQIVEGLPAVDASAGIEAVMAPNVEAAVVLKKPDATIAPK